MGKAYAAIVLLAGFLLSCGTAQKGDPLEAAAQAGDPIAACRLAARDLHACALQKTAGENAILTENLICYDTALDDRKQGYLEAGRKRYAADSPEPDSPGSDFTGAESRYSLMIIRLTLASAALPIASAKQAREATEDLEQGCAELEN
jgi:hypothetical protein